MDRLLTADEIAQRLGVTTQWVWAQARAGRIPHVRLGRYRRFREPAIEAWIRQLETESTTTASVAARVPVQLHARPQ
jgi:excisionase family DNA binding protein